MAERPGCDHDGCHAGAVLVTNHGRRLCGNLAHIAAVDGERIMWQVGTGSRPPAEWLAVVTDTTCPYCDRECPRCHYPIDGGWVHIEQPQAPESNVAVCNLKRYVGPMVDVIGDYLEHAQHRLTVVPDAT